MSLEKVAKEVKNSRNSISSLSLLLSSVSDLAKDNKNFDAHTFSSSLYTLREIFLQINPTMSHVRNILNYLIEERSHSQISPQEVLKRVSFVRNYVKESQKKISRFGNKKINSNGTVFVFGHDSFVLGILKSARSAGKKFKVNNTEMRPAFFGRKFAGELSGGGIKVNHYTDTSLKKAIAGVDIIFSDCTSILGDGVVLGNQGLELVADIALNMGIPLYICAPSWKISSNGVWFMDPTNNTRNIWNGAPQGVSLKGNTFDVVDPKFIKGIISELGLYSPQAFIEEAKYENVWKF